MSTCRAKFYVAKVAELDNVGGHVSKMYTKDSKETPVPAREITMYAVYDGSAENRSFAQSTPNGTLTFMLGNPDLAEAFKPGESYYIDFTKE
jgi:hypothetical protein